MASDPGRPAGGCAALEWGVTVPGGALRPQRGSRLKQTVGVGVTWSEALDVATRLGVAALGGLAVGIEREWSARARARPARFAGVRTFLLLGLLGGLGATLSELAGPAVGLVIVAAAAALVVGAYIVTARGGGDVDGTTEVSALVVLAAGALAGTGRLALASALSALTALVLVEKGRIHALVHRLQSETLEAAARFAVLALVVLPLCPRGRSVPSQGSGHASSGRWSCSSRA